MNYKAGKVWLTVSVTPELCIRMVVGSLREWTEHTPRSETGHKCHQLSLKFKAGLLSTYISILRRSILKHFIFYQNFRMYSSNWCLCWLLSIQGPNLRTDI